MYELVKKIMDRAMAENIDIGVAYDKIAAEEGRTEELRAAHEFYKDNYFVISALQVAKKFADIKVICDMQENGNVSGVETYIENLKNEGVVK